MIRDCVIHYLSDLLFNSTTTTKNSLFYLRLAILLLVTCWSSWVVVFVLILWPEKMLQRCGLCVDIWPSGQLPRNRWWMSFYSAGLPKQLGDGCVLGLPSMGHPLSVFMTLTLDKWGNWGLYHVSWGHLKTSRRSTTENEKKPTWGKLSSLIYLRALLSIGCTV